MNSNYFHSVILNSKRCIGCTYCLKICPTEAIRLKDGKAKIIPERCIDCGECIRVCPSRAKNSVTDNIDILKEYKYNIALVLPILYGQFAPVFSPSKVQWALKSLGFDEVVDTSIGSQIIDSIIKPVIAKYKNRPVINSACPAIVRLLQVSFPDLLDNLIDIETPVEITARIIKQNTIQKTSLPEKRIGITLITPCTAMVTSVKNPLGTTFSSVDASISIKDIYAPMLKKLSSSSSELFSFASPTHNSLLWYSAGGQLAALPDENTLAVDGISNAISVFEEIEMGRLDHLSFIEAAACPGGCLGGPLVVENRFIALNNIKNILEGLQKTDIDFSENQDEFFKMYENGFIRLTEEILPISVMSLDNDIKKSIQKMDAIQNIVNDLPGINCGICGSPTCRAFAEDIVTGSPNDTVCPVLNIVKKNKESND